MRSAREPVKVADAVHRSGRMRGESGEKFGGVMRSGSRSAWGSGTLIIRGFFEDIRVFLGMEGFIQKTFHWYSIII